MRPGGKETSGFFEGGTHMAAKSRAQAATIFRRGKGEGGNIRQQIDQKPRVVAYQGDEPGAGSATFTENSPETGEWAHRAAQYPSHNRGKTRFGKGRYDEAQSIVQVRGN